MLYDSPRLWLHSCRSSRQHIPSYTYSKSCRHATWHTLCVDAPYYVVAFVLSPKCSQCTGDVRQRPDASSTPRGEACDPAGASPPTSYAARGLGWPCWALSAPTRPDHCCLANCSKKAAAATAPPFLIGVDARGVRHSTTTAPCSSSCSSDSLLPSRVSPGFLLGGAGLGARGRQ